MSSEFWQVAVDAPLKGALTYLAPLALRAELKAGQRVRVPLGKRTAQGVLLVGSSEAPDRQIKEILNIELEHRPLPGFFLSWLTWVSDYYLHPVGATAALAYPPLKKGSEKAMAKRARVLPSAEEVTKFNPNLTSEQKKVVDAIQDKKGFSTHLLFGVTGSGKTEVYMQLLQNVIGSGKRGLILVPEISLTPQLVSRFVARFGDQVAVLHSQLTDRERTNQWWDMVEDRKTILIGARSALFCPIENLGLIVVDEEHEASFKQEEKLKYHGRDAAVLLGKFADCPVVLGSATPSLESWKNAIEGKYELHRMDNRVENRAFPEIQIVDLKEVEKDPDLPNWLSPKLYDAIAENLQAGHQTALFLNRRGAAALVICPDCGFTHQCPNCDINLTLHGKSHLVCHYCDYHENFAVKCPDCKEGELTPIGLGTENLETEIQRLFPAARLARADRDEISGRGDMEELVQRMEAQEIDILIGTQMIAKGLDFPHLKLVGIVLADIGFNIPDFRSTERSFQLITQVAGRSGRHVKANERPGQVIIQTFNPDHESLQFSFRRDYEGFAQQELQNRRGLNYPPYGRIISIRIQGQDLGRVQEVAKLFAKRGQQLKSQNQNYQEIEILGPAPAPLARLRGKHRYYLLLKGKQAQNLNRFYRQVTGDEQWVQAGVRILADVDPLHLL